MNKVSRTFFSLVLMITPLLSHAQIAAYGTFSVSDFHNLVTTDYLSGATVGLLAEGPHALRYLRLSGDLQARFVAGNGEKYSSLAIGPRVSLPLGHSGKTAPFGEFLVGFGRYSGNARTALSNGVAGNQTTDATILVDGGVTRMLSKRWDAVGEFSYSQYFAYGGQYNPKTFSAGAVYHFNAR